MTDEILRLLDARSRLDVLVNDRFTEQLKRALSLACDEAGRLEHGYIGTEHFLLLGLMREGKGVAAQALQNLGITWEEIERKIERAVAPLREQNGAMPVTPRAKRVLELAAEEASDLGHEHVGTEHLLLGLVREGNGVAARVVFDCGVDLQRVTDEVLRLLGKPPSRRRMADPDVFTEAMIRVLLQKGIVTEGELAQGLIDALNRGREERLALRLDLRLYGRLRSEILRRVLIRKGIVTQKEIDTELGQSE